MTYNGGIKWWLDNGATANVKGGMFSKGCLVGCFPATHVTRSTQTLHQTTINRRSVHPKLSECNRVSDVFIQPIGFHVIVLWTMRIGFRTQDADHVSPFDVKL